jgi:hypothetical protein
MTNGEKDGLGVLYNNWWKKCTLYSGVQRF